MTNINRDKRTGREKTKSGVRRFIDDLVMFRCAYNLSIHLYSQAYENAIWFIAGGILYHGQL